MAEAIAVVGLLASIASLIDFSFKVSSRIYEYSSSFLNIPQSLRSLSTQLPLLEATLNRVKLQAQSGLQSNATAQALRLVVDDLLADLKVIERHLRATAPSFDASKSQRLAAALKSFSNDRKLRKAFEKINKGINILIFHQTTHHVDALGPALQSNTSSTVVVQSLGLRLNKAPQIVSDAFKGRISELERLKEWLIPRSDWQGQSIVSIVGMGGVGKTQLSLAHARECRNEYSSVFWINAKDEASLKQSIVYIYSIVFHETLTKAKSDDICGSAKSNELNRWLSRADNDRWLLIFDNYDDCSLTGSSSPTGFDIRPYFPARSHGSILITTRSNKLNFSKKLRLHAFQDLQTSVSILSQRSGRNLANDISAPALSKRLGGLPLALATAGKFLASTSCMSCGEYLQLYESTWVDLVGDPSDELHEYEARTLASTWKISLERLQQDDDDAANLLTLFAYLNRSYIWYELIKAGTNQFVPWLNRVTKDKLRFVRAMAKLHDYCLVDVDMTENYYHIHPCLHDWLVATFAMPPNDKLFLTAVKCVGQYCNYALENEAVEVRPYLLQHMVELWASRLQNLWSIADISQDFLHAYCGVAFLLRRQNRCNQSEKLSLKAMASRKSSPNLQDEVQYVLIDELIAVNICQQKYTEAQRMCLENISQRMTEDGSGKLNVRRLICYLAWITYYTKEDLKEVEILCRDILPTVDGFCSESTSTTVDVYWLLGRTYRIQRRYEESERMFVQAIELDKKQGFHNNMVLRKDLLDVYLDQWKLSEAEQTALNALLDVQWSLPYEPIHTFIAWANLAWIYHLQGKLDDAEDARLRVSAVKVTISTEEIHSCYRTILRSPWEQLTGVPHHNNFRSAPEKETSSLNSRL